MILVALGAAWAWERWVHPGGPPPTSPAFPEEGHLVGRMAPDFALPLLTATGSPRRVLALHTLRGRPVVVNFWASWCAPCRAETPLLVRAARTFEARGVVFLGVNVQDDPRDAQRFLEEFHVTYPVVRDASDRTMRAYDIIGLPTTLFIGRDGRVQGERIGGFTGPEGEKALWERLSQLAGVR